MKATSAAAALVAFGLAVASPLDTVCTVDGKSGTCVDTAQGCPGGAFYPGTQSPYPCPGGNNIECCISGPAALPGLEGTQSDHARAIIAENAAENLGKQGCLAAIATALTESSIYVYANSDVPDSFNYPYDKVGSDYDSIGIFQQRASIYTDIAADMDPAGSARQFFSIMVTIDGWQTMDVGELCQAVQRSAYPDRYDDNLPLATQICAEDGFA